MRPCTHHRWQTYRSTKGWGVRCVACQFVLSWGSDRAGAVASRKALNLVGISYAAYKARAAKAGAA